ncbi:type II toxin-antitoxin system PemK/MazF family toxin [Helicobacter sp. 11S03491-1]|uniref:type II toxin-antitoxin system PemK/MazF family toxin n=1 Tax=Helicobacter sp. 11S03491-1 TaxID=1476196 RepID=UPI000BA7159A|nr:type II toxin-antitoxin system PemK/MazF family toxin [Helicobacter sp. 11S03491-1]PAF41293.1 transcriptional regulator [Helicobacter sp. 11S03491-1]
MKRFEIWYINLDPTQGKEVKKTRPCVIVSPDELNDLYTRIVIPLTTKGFDLPCRLRIQFNNKSSLLLCDHIRSVDKSRLINKIGELGVDDCMALCEILNAMFAF